MEYPNGTSIIYLIIYLRESCLGPWTIRDVLAVDKTNGWRIVTRGLQYQERTDEKRLTRVESNEIFSKCPSKFRCQIGREVVPPGSPD